MYAAYGAGGNVDHRVFVIAAHFVRPGLVGGLDEFFIRVLVFIYRFHLVLVIDGQLHGNEQIRVLRLDGVVVVGDDLQHVLGEEPLVVLDRDAVFFLIKTLGGTVNQILHGNVLAILLTAAVRFAVAGGQHRAADADCAKQCRSAGKKMLFHWIFLSFHSKVPRITLPQNPRFVKISPQKKADAAVRPPEKAFVMRGTVPASRQAYP